MDPRTHRPIVRGPARRPHAVRLAPALLEDDPNHLRPDAVWIQVAREGSFKGHSSGEFLFDQKAFDELVRNFRAHPSYEKGEDGWGVADVIPYDFHHESEARGGSIAVVGAPAAAWALDLDVRAGGTGLELWALTRYLEPARGYVQEGKYKWTSVAVWPDAVDPVTGAKIGWYLSSIAFTNDPFIQGMAPIAAETERRASLLLEDPALDVDCIMQDLRWIFGLSATAGVAEVRVELAKLVAMEAAAAAPAGVDLAALVARLRDLLRLPVLTPTAEVFSAASELLDRLDNATPPQSVNANRAAPAERGNDTTMHPKLFALVKSLKLRATVTNDDEAIEALRIELDGAQGAREKLAAIGKLFGVENPEQVLDEVTKTVAELEKLRASVPELEELIKSQATEEDTQATDDVDKAMEAHRMPPSSKAAMLAFRTGSVELDGKAKDLKDRIARRRAQRTKFLEAYPVPKTSLDYLQRPIVTKSRTEPTPQQLSAGRGAQPVLADEPPGAPPQTIDLSRMPGRNHIEQAMAFVRSQPGNAKLSHDACWKQACELLQQARETDRPAPLH